jgi:CheY-like chemotaxis protein
MTDPAAIVEAARAFHEETAKLNRANRSSRTDLQKRLGQTEAQLKRLLDAIQFSDDAVADLMPRLKQLQQQRAELTEKLRQAEAEANVVELHPHAINAYRGQVEALCSALTSSALDADARAAFRALVDSVVVHPTPARAPYELTTYGRLDAIMGGGGRLFPSGVRRIAWIDNVAPAFAGDDTHCVAAA